MLDKTNPANLKPSLEALSYALRNPDLWPKDFGPWNYLEWKTCAYGLALAFWGEDAHDEICNNSNLQCKIFFDSHKGMFLSVQPNDVADTIDEYLNSIA